MRRTTAPRPSAATNRVQSSQPNRNNQQTDFPPRLTHQPHDVRVKPREPLTVECPVEAQPESEVKWFKDGQVLASEPAHLEQTGSELMFFQINEADTGDYHCQAENYLGRASSEPFRLTVQSSKCNPGARLAGFGRIRAAPAVVMLLLLLPPPPLFWWRAERAPNAAPGLCHKRLAEMHRPGRATTSRKAAAVFPSRLIDWRRHGAGLR
jgi:hypothetical protein